MGILSSRLVDSMREMFEGCRSVRDGKRERPCVPGQDPVVELNLSWQDGKGVFADKTVIEIRTGKPARAMELPNKGAVD